MIGYSKSRQKCGKSVCAKDIIPQRWKFIEFALEVTSVLKNLQKKLLSLEEVRAPEVALSPEDDIVSKLIHASIEVNVLENYEILMSYVYKVKILDHKSVRIDYVYAF